jgi:hypothetical protein
LGKTLQRLIPIFLLFCFVWQLADRVSLYIDYELNKEYITLKFCENKMKPGSGCEGKCYLAKKLSEGLKKEIPPATHEKPVQELQFLSAADVDLNQVMKHGVKIRYAPFREFFPVPVMDEFYHPPCKTAC